MADSGIYEIVNLVNGKRYVGSALDFPQRWHKHRSELRRKLHHSKHLQNAWAKYGEAAFEFRVLERCGRDVILLREQFHIDQGCEYNKYLTAGSPLGVKHSPESRQRMSASRAGKPKSERHVAAMASGAKTQWADPEIRAKMSEAIKENWALRKAQGYKHPPLTPEQRAKQSAGVKEDWKRRKARASA